MKRILREIWIVIALVWLVGALALSFFETQASGLVGREKGYWFMRNMGLLLEIGAGEGFGWVFGLSGSSHYCGTFYWPLDESAVKPFIHYVKPSQGFEFQIGIPHWIPVTLFLAIGLFRLRLRGVLLPRESAQN